MRSRFSSLPLATLSGLSLALAVGCASSSGTPLAAPTITSFTATAPVVASGTGTTLTAVFDAGYQGSACVDGGIGTILSGAPMATGNLTACTSFTLTVSNRAGATVTSRASVAVQGLYAFAGVPGGLGDVDGLGGAARFYDPQGVCLDPATGDLYLADKYNYTIRKITPAGLVSTLAGVPLSQGTADTATGVPATFWAPSQLTVDGLGNLFLMDNGVLRQVSASTGRVTTLAAHIPAGGPLAGDGAGNTYAVGSDGIHLNNAAAPLTLTGTPGGFAFGNVTGLALDAGKNLYLSYTGTTPQVFKLTFAGGSPGSWAFEPAWGSGTAGHADGPGATARFYQPGALAVDGSGNIFVADRFCIRMIQVTNPVTQAATVTTVAGSWDNPGYEDGTGVAVRFGGGTSAPRAPVSGLALDAAGALFVGDPGNECVRRLTLAAGQGTVATFAGKVSVLGGTDGPGAAATFNNPASAVVDASGNVFVADTWNDTIRRITPDGTVSTVADLVAPAPYGYGSISGVAVDAAGNLYASTFDDQNMIFKLAPGGQPVALASSLDDPQGLAVDAQGNIFWADAQDDVIYCLTPDGVMSTLAGTVGVAGHTDSADGPPLFSSPMGVALDRAGNVYVADTLNDAIRKIAFTWTGGAPGNVVVTTLAGSPGQSGTSDGIGAAARFHYPVNLAVDGGGTLYVADTHNNTLRKVTAAGVVSTVLGFPGSASLPPRVGTVPGLLPASLYGPTSVAIDPASGALFVTVTDSVLKVWL